MKRFEAGLFIFIFSFFTLMVRVMMPMLIYTVDREFVYFILYFMYVCMCFIKILCYKENEYTLVHQPPPPLAKIYIHIKYIRWL